MNETNGGAGETIIEAAGLVKRYGAKSILDGVDFAVRRGETVAVLGPSGGGKSTMLRCLNGLNGWDAGRVRVLDQVLEATGTPPVGEAARRVRSRLGMVFQDFQLFPHLTALENVCEGPVRVRGKSRTEAREQAAGLLDRVGLGERRGHYPDQLSGGQKQRVAIARALAMEPEGLLCDEVTSALDPEMKHEILEVLEDLKGRGLTLVMVTHEIGFARRAADRIVVLAGGKMIEDGPPEQVLDRPKNERTKQFLSRVLG
jgi:polar amino acid transport system ATP-binding protein